ncbi:WD40 repeat-like protein [Rhizoclosmatium globosum]|uniref:WD40 repeat-like protein n=1 Tax=Rhizoclosmatium globosum TaxID=329046 RepID=A0A1Y2CEV5_9FUNG|nr:WD40 repeat-like protein [Rhizoclosmatium globosum]|eukprot:ORY45466.1 WD40 repeat-like protein [Rhizoclosmatium globosum]
MTGRVRRRTGVSQVHRPNTFCLAFDENWAVVVSQGEPGRLVDVKRLTQKYVLTGGIDSTIRVWKIKIVAIQCDANVIATGSEDHTIRVWKTKTGEPLQVLTGHTGAVSCLQIHNNTIISGSIDHSIRIWNYTTGTCTKEIKAHSGYVYALQVHNSEIITGSSDGTIKIWALDSPTTSTNRSNGSGDYSVKVWNRKTGACLYTLNHHSATVWSLNCVGTKLMTSSFDTSLVVLDFAEEIPEE